MSKKNNIEIIKKDVKNITLKVKPNGRVLLTTPVSMTKKNIDKFILRKENWIKKTVENFEKKYIPIFNKDYVSGESFYYLGKKYRLKVIKDKKEYVKLKNGWFELHVKDIKNKRKKEIILDKWYREKAEYKFMMLSEKYMKVLDEQECAFKIRKMKKRWGSCNSEKRIILINLELIKKQVYCIEYIILHELLHLKIPNHSKEFWKLLTLYMPDWKYRKEKLEEVM